MNKNEKQPLIAFNDLFYALAYYVAMELGSKNCSNYSSEQEQYFILSTVSCSVGVLSSLAAIILLLVSKGYKEFIHRLFLYLSTAALVVCAGQLLYVVEKEYSIYIVFIRVTAFVISYMSLIYFSLLSWIGFYMFWLTVFKVQLKKIKHEVIGLGIVLVIPLTFSWLMLYQVHTCFNPKTDTAHHGVFSLRTITDTHSVGFSRNRGCPSDIVSRR